MTNLTLVKWTVEDYHQMIQAGILAERRVELIAGDIVEMPPEQPIHAEIGWELNFYLQRVLGQQAKVREAHPITLPDSEPEPDIAVVFWKSYRDHHPYPEDIYLIIEIANTTLEKDLKDKKSIYASAQIPEYWIVDVQHQMIQIFRQPAGNTYLSQAVMSQGNITPLAFPDILIEIDRIWDSNSPSG